MIDRRIFVDEGSKAIIKEIAREICDTQYEKIEKTAKEYNRYLDEKFINLERKIDGVGSDVNKIKTKGCAIALDHVSEHKEKEKKITRNVTIISTLIPTIILLGSWIKSLIIGWIQRPPTQ